MKYRATILMAVLILCAGITYAADESVKASPGDFGKDTVTAVGDTAKSAVDGTANIADTSVKNTAETPTTAIQAVKDTANKAFSGVDAALKTLTGDK